MTRPEASEKIKTSCKTIALEMMELNPTIASLGDTEKRKETLKPVLSLI